MSQSHGYNASSAQGQPSQGGHPQHYPCCTQAVLQLNSLYYNACNALQITQKQLYQAQDQVHEKQDQINKNQDQIDKNQDQIDKTQLELQRERQTSELHNQRFMDLDQHCIELQDINKALQDNLNQSQMVSQAHAEKVAKNAESVINHLRAKLAGGEVAEVQNGQSVSMMILESAKNAVLVDFMSGGYSEEHILTEQRSVMDQNIVFQQHIADLSQQVENLRKSEDSLVKQVQAGNSEIMNLNKALEITTPKSRRRMPRHVKAENS